MSNVKKRIAYVDIAKILGMFFIIYGHTLRNGEVTTWIYTFHVPLFFFLSGVTFHGEVLDIKNIPQKESHGIVGSLLHLGIDKYRCFCCDVLVYSDAVDSAI